MRTKTEPPVAPEVAILEEKLTEVIPVESDRETKEAEVERIRAKKLKELSPELRIIDRKERKLKQTVLNIVKKNKNKKGFFREGMRSVVTRSGTAGMKKGPKHIKLGVDVEEADVLKKLKQYYPEKYDMFVRVSLHRTTLRQAIVNGEVNPNTLGVSLVQHEHPWYRTRKAKREATKAKSGKGKKVTA